MSFKEEGVKYFCRIVDQDSPEVYASQLNGDSLRQNCWH